MLILTNIVGHFIFYLLHIFLFFFSCQEPSLIDQNEVPKSNVSHSKSQAGHYLKIILNTGVRSPGFTLTLKGSYGLVIKVFLKIIFPAVETASDYHIQLKDSGWLL